MKLSYVRLRDKGMQVKHGRLTDSLTAPFYEMELISNLRMVKVTSEGWSTPVYIPCERLDNLSPDPDSLISKK